MTVAGPSGATASICRSIGSCRAWAAVRGVDPCAPRSRAVKPARSGARGRLAPDHPGATNAVVCGLRGCARSTVSARRNVRLTRPNVHLTSTASTEDRVGRRMVRRVGYSSAEGPESARNSALAGAPLRCSAHLAHIRRPTSTTRRGAAQIATRRCSRLHLTDPARPTGRPHGGGPGSAPVDG